MFSRRLGIFVRRRRDDFVFQSFRCLIEFFRKLASLSGLLIPLRLA